MKLGKWPKFQTLHIYSRSELIFALRAAVPEIQANFQNWYMWA